MKESVRNTPCYVVSNKHVLKVQSEARVELRFVFVGTTEVYL